MTFAVPLLDLDTIWRTPAGAALVEAALEDQEAAPVVTLGETDGVVLGGPKNRVAALVAALVTTPLPTASGRPVRVFERQGRGWARVTVPPVVPRLPDEVPTFE